MATLNHKYATSYGAACVSDNQKRNKNGINHKKHCSRGQRKTCKSLQRLYYCSHCNKWGHSMRFCYTLKWCALCDTFGHNPFSCRKYSTISTWMTTAKYKNLCAACLNPIVKGENKCNKCGTPNVYWLCGGRQNQSSQTESNQVDIEIQNSSEDFNADGFLSNKSIDDRLIPNGYVNKNVKTEVNSGVSPTLNSHISENHKEMLLQMQNLTKELKQHKSELNSRLSGLDSSLSSVNNLVTKSFEHLSDKIENNCIGAQVPTVIQIHDTAKVHQILQAYTIHWEALFKKQESDKSELLREIAFLKHELRDSVGNYKNLSQLQSISVQKEQHALKRVKKLNLKLYETETKCDAIKVEKDRLLIEIQNRDSRLAEQEILINNFNHERVDNSLLIDAHINVRDSKEISTNVFKLETDPPVDKICVDAKYANNNIKNKQLNAKLERLLDSLKSNIMSQDNFSAQHLKCSNYQHPEDKCSEYKPKGRLDPNAITICYSDFPLSQKEKVEGIQSNLVSKIKCFASHRGETISMLQNYQKSLSTQRVDSISFHKTFS